MNANELIDKMTILLDEADNPEEAIKAIAVVQYTVWAGTYTKANDRTVPIKQPDAMKPIL